MKNRATKYVDLRCSRRLTVAEVESILGALDATNATAPNLRSKLAAALMLATHTCLPDRNGRCPICGVDVAASQRVRARRAKEFQQVIARSKTEERRIRLEAAARRPAPPLRLVPATEVKA